jgi:hypothetical protein
LSVVSDSDSGSVRSSPQSAGKGSEEMPNKFKPSNGSKSKIRIKRNDMVVVIAGKDKGPKAHRVLRALA